MRLTTWDHCCKNVHGCGLKILETAPNGRGGKVRKLLLWVPGTRLSRFVGSVGEAVDRATVVGYHIPEEDIEACHRLIQP